MLSLPSGFYFKHQVWCIFIILWRSMQLVNNISVREKVQNCSYEVSSWRENYLCKYWVWRSNHFPSLSLTHTACLSLSTQIDVYRFEIVNSLPISEFITWEHLQTDPIRKPELALPVSIPSDEPQARTVSLPLWGGCWGLCQKGVRSVSVCVYVYVSGGMPLGQRHCDYMIAVMKGLHSSSYVQQQFFKDQTRSVLWWSLQVWWSQWNRFIS